MLQIANISKRKCHSLEKEGKIILRKRADEAKPATFEATEREATTGVGELESKRRLLILFFHSKLCMKFLFHTAPK